MTAVAVTLPPPASRTAWGRPPCRCCGVKPANRRRGLCCGCHADPANRERFPSTSKYAARGVAGRNAAALPVPAAPTAAVAGSDEKLLVLVARAAAGVNLWHPLDGPRPD